jgi:hypothetical protein
MQKQFVIPRPLKSSPALIRTKGERDVTTSLRSGQVILRCA